MAMHDRDLYAVLGVDPHAPPEEIRRAYRRLARKWHPDLNPDDPTATERFKQLNAAVAVLADPVQRQFYDAAIAVQARNASRNATAFVEQGYDVVYPVQITAKDAASGIICQLRFHDPDGRPRDIQIVVPPGARPGDRVRVPGAGGPNRHGQAYGDLIAVVQIVAAQATLMDEPDADERQIVDQVIGQLLLAALLVALLVLALGCAGLIWIG